MLRARVTRFASRLGSRRLGQFETQAQLAQGKGWGDATVAAETAAVRELLGSAAEEALVVLDVGANVGAWTRHALRELPNATVHAFEPSSVAFGRLSSALGAEPRVSIHQIALSNADGEAVLYANEPGSGAASLTQRRLDHIGVDFSCEESVVTRTLQSWSRSHGLSAVDVLKLDVEGHEMDVLRGAGRLLDSTRVVQFEFGGCNIDTRTYFQDFWYFLTGAGLRIHRLGPDGLHAVDEYSERDEVFVTTNYFASRR